nr:unnamed protein product [Callosobruchus chinensis]
MISKTIYNDPTAFLLIIIIIIKERRVRSLLSRCGKTILLD